MSEKDTAPLEQEPGYDQWHQAKNILQGMLNRVIPESDQTRPLSFSPELADAVVSGIVQQDREPREAISSEDLKNPEVAQHLLLSSLTATFNRVHGPARRLPSKAEQSLRGFLFNELFSMGFEEATHLMQRVGNGVYNGSKDSEWNKKKSVEKITSVAAHMLDLEATSPGSVATLHRDYGIHHFDRYYPNELLAMLARGPRRGDIVVLTATADWNGALDNGPDEVRETLGKRAIGRRHLIFVEAHGLRSLAERLIFIKNRAGPIEQIVINAHGNSSEVDFGHRDNEHDTLTLNDIKNSKSIGKLKKRGILARDARVVLFSCNVGEKGGIAELIHEKSGAKVVAPDFVSRGIGKTALGGVYFRGAKGEKGAVTYS